MVPTVNADTVFAIALIIEIVLVPLLVMYALVPSGVIATALGALPTAMVADNALVNVFITATVLAVLLTT